MKKLLSLPPNLVGPFKSVESRYNNDDWFCTCDPEGHRIGSGGGTVWLLERWKENNPAADSGEKKILIHAGGQSRRLPAYAAVGKVLTPVPVLRWAVGNTIDQNLLSLQLPLYEKLMALTSASQNTLIASGDVCLRADGEIKSVPEADVVCYGIWCDPSTASRHGVFLSSHDSPEVLDYMLQKPSVEQLNRLSTTHYYMLDIGLWILSDRAIDLLSRRAKNSNGEIDYYDLYSQFGCALGENPSVPDPLLAGLTTAIVPLPGGEFYHFGTTRELLSSTLALQNKVVDQRLILHRKSKPNPALFVQNCHIGKRLTAENENIWIENSHIGARWVMTQNNVVTGVPVNDWEITLTPDVCLDIAPVDADKYAVRPYGYDDMMRGMTSDATTTYLGMPLQQWLTTRDITLPADSDIQDARLFPLVKDVTEMGIAARWMTNEPELAEGKRIWLEAEKISADEICSRISLERLYAQRTDFLRTNIGQLADNYEHSVFYQLDLDDVATKICSLGLDAPDPLPESATTTERMRNHMLRAAVASHRGIDSAAEESKAYSLLSQSILASIDNARCLPTNNVYSDQIVWGRSPVRIDLAGGWSDTPPYSMLRGGNVVNVAVELNGQPPLQVFVKPCKEPHIILRSIDLGAIETIETYEQLTDYSRIGSPFSIPKAALALAGFAPDFCAERYASLRQQLETFGSGIELTLLSAVPAGSGLGTSSILASTVLASLNNFCSLAWDASAIGNRTLALEQMLTTCGGWQDQYGGMLQGVKLLQTEAGWHQQPRINWLPDGIFTDTMHAPCHILYYTGLTRTAKNILGDIVSRMFLNSGSTLSLLDEIRIHALQMAEAIQRCDFAAYGKLLATTWQQNQLLDSGTNPAAVQAIIDSVSDYLTGCKLPGAGGGGFLYMVAKDPEAAVRIRQTLTANPVNPRARFVDLTISKTGLQVSRS